MRRYARALLGSLRFGEVSVARVLDDLIASGQELPLEPVALYRCLIRAVSSLSEQDPEGVGQRVPSIARQAYLLNALSNFPGNEVAYILETDPASGQRLIEQGFRAPSFEIYGKVLLVHDDIFVALELEQELPNLGHRWVGCARTAAEAVALAKKLEPDIILTRTKLADYSSGLMAMREVQEFSNPAVVIVTGVPGLFLRGDRPEPTFILGMPIRREQLAALLSQALYFRGAAKEP
jgi:hypothetical protein